MIGSAELPIVVAAAGGALLVWPRPRPEPLRSGVGDRFGARSPVLRAAMLGVALAASLAVLFPDAWWLALLCGTGAGLAARRVGRGRTRPADLPRLALYCDLLAGCLEAGMAIGPALDVVGATIRSPSENRRSRAQARFDPLARLQEVGALLALGADSEVAWAATADLADLAPLAAAARRSARGGAPMAEAVHAHARELRERAEAASTASAARAGVAMAAPLALCFLPGFICLGLAPIVIGLIGQLDVF